MALSHSSSELPSSRLDCLINVVHEQFPQAIEIECDDDTLDRLVEATGEGFNSLQELEALLRRRKDLYEPEWGAHRCLEVVLSQTAERIVASNALLQQRSAPKGSREDSANALFFHNSDNVGEPQTLPSTPSYVPPRPGYWSQAPVAHDPSSGSRTISTQPTPIGSRPRRASVPWSTPSDTLAPYYAGYQSLSGGYPSLPGGYPSLPGRGPSQFEVTSAAGNRPHVCAHCDKKFTTRSNLQRHEASRHRGVRLG